MGRRRIGAAIVAILFTGGLLAIGLAALAQHPETSPMTGADGAQGLGTVGVLLMVGGVLLLAAGRRREERPTADFHWD